MLKNIQVFADLTPQERLKLEEIAVLRSYTAGQAVYNEGEVANNLYLILRGAVQVSKHIPGQDPLVICKMQDGDVFGEGTILADTPHSTTVQACQKTQLAVLGHRQLQEIFTRQPTLANKVYRKLAIILCSRMRETNQNFEDFFIWSLTDKAPATPK